MYASAAQPSRCDDVAARWAASGAMALTGRSDGPASVAPAAVALAAAQWASELCAVASQRGVALDLDGPALLGERAACAGLARRGRVSAGGSARLVRAADGWLAVSLPRAEDLAALPAWLESDALRAGDAWPALERAVRERACRELVERARWIGLAIAETGAPDPSPPPAARRIAIGERAAKSRAGAPLVVDLSSLWAGPLCAQLLGAAGARVVKVESTRRPDGARAGPSAFFDLLNAGKSSVALDLATAEGVAALRALIGAADLVVESARPRALSQLGISAEEELAARAGLVWVSITGYGRTPPYGDWVAFGDDAAAAAGLAMLAGRDDDGPLFCADAVADPLTGLFAAGAALEAWQQGGGVLLDVSLRDVAAQALAAAPPPQEWKGEVAAPRTRAATGRARPLGADTHAVLAELGRD